MNHVLLYVLYIMNENFYNQVDGHNWKTRVHLVL